MSPEFRVDFEIRMEGLGELFVERLEVTLLGCFDLLLPPLAFEGGLRGLALASGLRAGTESGIEKIGTCSGEPLLQLFGKFVRVAIRVQPVKIKFDSSLACDCLKHCPKLFKFFADVFLLFRSRLCVFGTQNSPLLGNRFKRSQLLIAETSRVSEELVKLITKQRRLVSFKRFELSTKPTTN